MCDDCIASLGNYPSDRDRVCSRNRYEIRKNTVASDVISRDLYRGIVEIVCACPDCGRREIWAEISLCNQLIRPDIWYHCQRRIVVQIKIRVDEIVVATESFPLRDDASSIVRPGRNDGGI